MNRHLSAALVAGSLALALAPGVAHAESPEHSIKLGPLSAEDVKALIDARIAALKAGLKLTPEQEKNWPSLDAALREAASSRAARAGEWPGKIREAHEKGDVLARMRLHAKDLIARGTEMEKVAEAAAPLYASLDDAQKRRFGLLLRLIAGSAGRQAN